MLNKLLCFTEVKCSSWCPHDKFGHIRDVSFQHPIKIYFAEVVARSKAWLGRGFSCVCAQSRESDARPSFDLTPSQLRFETEDKARRLLVMCHFC
ncbi:uncharacterized protein [Gossypium hirsutum]|uniref:Uncharacterized protein isoform X5 n=1 Tax=Gossypium hirsutum TaxID=3635 RepID=A0A1U8N8W7_GOSHI|nr:uncharacterized protein LOC107945911 isoform X5 [Gossypium hirsutum]